MHYISNELHREIQKNHTLKWFTQFEFFSLGDVKDTVYRPPPPHDLQELRQRIITAVTAIEEDLLEKVWQELDYRLDVCHVTRSAHIKCL
jgi:hypothetical protein